MIAKLNARRMTLTLPVLTRLFGWYFSSPVRIKRNSARRSGGKADPPYPSQLVQPRNDGLKLFLVDQDAAALLDPATLQKPTPEGKPSGSSRGKPGKNA